MRIAVLRCAQLPRFVTWEIPDIEVFFEDDRQLVAALEARGAEASLVAWTDERIDWSGFDAAVIRSTWDYIDQRDRFLKVLASIEASSCVVMNPLEAVRWNSDKHYLLDLESRGVAIVPTFRAWSEDWPQLRSRFIAERWHTVVLKPAVGAGGAGVHRLAVDDVEEALSRLATQHPNVPHLIQPLADAVVTEGEWSFIHIGGELSHTLLKRPAAGDYRAHSIYGGSVERAEPSEDDQRQVAAMLQTLPFELAFARLDLVRVGGRLAVMELELIEPMLYFEFAPEGIARLARAILTRLDAHRTR